MQGCIQGYLFLTQLKEARAEILNKMNHDAYGCEEPQVLV